MDNNFIGINPSKEKTNPTTIEQITIKISTHKDIPIKAKKAGLKLKNFFIENKTACIGFLSPSATLTIDKKNKTWNK